MAPLLNYRCTPGTPVDRYRSGYKTFILISRREVKNRGDIEEFNINAIFPKSRPPKHTILIEDNRQRSHNLGKDFQQLLPDGRWLVTWETDKPGLHET